MQGLLEARHRVTTRRAYGESVMEEALRLADGAAKPKQAPQTPSGEPNAPFAELVRLSRTSIADEMREEYRRRVLGD
jgi:hypothetical protein